MKKMMAGAVVTLIAVGVALAGAPVQANPGECRMPGGGLYLCKYEPLGRGLPGGGSEQFVVGTDEAIWTRWKAESGPWSDWHSFGGVSRSEVFIESHWEGNKFVTVITHLGTDGKPYSKKRPASGQAWTAWYPS